MFFESAPNFFEGRTRGALAGRQWALRYQPLWARRKGSVILKILRLFRINLLSYVTVSHLTVRPPKGAPSVPQYAKPSTILHLSYSGLGYHGGLYKSRYRASMFNFNLELSPQGKTKVEWTRIAYSPYSQILQILLRFQSTLNAATSPRQLTMSSGKAMGISSHLPRPAPITAVMLHARLTTIRWRLVLTPRSPGLCPSLCSNF